MLNWRDTENPLAGGAERVTLRHMAELVRRGHEVVWFANHFDGAERETTIDGIRIIRGGGRGTSILHACRCCRDHGPFDLLIDQHHGLPWFAHWWSGTKYVAYIHEVLGPIWRAFYRWPTSTIGQAQERFFQRLYAGVPFWTVSESTRQQLLSHGVRDVRVWPNGTDTEPMPTLPAKPLAKPLRLIALARLAPNKRVDHVVRALALLCEQGCDAELTIIGWGQDQWRLEAQVNELGLSDAVRFAGRLDD
ncbi:MAG TPA: glycosyltransferase family 4 protein, partial [Verrucomicrobiota bacterium]|nr:glycosyltransferase family 4 protein [Verrucomicrobiota bacterium]